MTAVKETCKYITQQYEWISWIKCQVKEIKCKKYKIAFIQIKKSSKLIYDSVSLHSGYNMTGNDRKIEQKEFWG